MIRGHNSGKRLREDIHRFVQEDDYEKAVDVLREGMKATHIVRQSREDGQRGIVYEEVPDHGTRMHAAKLTLEYGFGKPATRHNITVDDKTKKTVSPAEVMSRLRDSGSQLADIMDVYSDSARKVELIETLELENGE
jgi:hypothetical protein